MRYLLSIQKKTCYQVRLGISTLNSRMSAHSAQCRDLRTRSEKCGPILHSRLLHPSLCFTLHHIRLDELWLVLAWKNSGRNSWNSLDCGLGDTVAVHLMTSCAVLSDTSTIELHRQGTVRSTRTPPTREAEWPVDG